MGPRDLYAVKNPDGEFQPWSLAFSRGSCWELLIAEKPELIDKEIAIVKGWRCKRVEIVEVPGG